MDRPFEKREYRRLDINIAVSYDLDKGRKWTETETKNLSAGGICLLTKEALQAGTHLTLKFRLPDTSESLEVRGEIMWNQKYVINDEEYYDNGIKFIAMSERERGLIGKYIDGIAVNG
ncbi:MAG: PilZ domain-containing protein [Spirochaetales bacterium]|nr:PilZ domain-containing protein [Spirochaetales bacterium]